MASLEYPSLRGPKRLGDRLLEAGLVTRTQLDAALVRQEGGGGRRQRIGRTLVDLGVLADRDLTQILSVHLSIPVAPFSIAEPEERAITALPAAVAHRHRALPCRVVGGSLLIVVADVASSAALEELRSASGCRVLLYLAPATDVDEALRKHYGRVSPDRFRALARRLEQIADEYPAGDGHLRVELEQLRTELDAVLAALADPD